MSLSAPDISRPADRRAPPPATPLRAALALLQVGCLGVVLAALGPGPFELERYAVPKELVLHVVAFGAAALALAGARRPVLRPVDPPLAAFVALSGVAAVGAGNHWLAFQSLGITVAGALVFWTARAGAEAGRRWPLLVFVAAAVLAGAAGGLLQSYGHVSALNSLSRAPGGTFGNRNFMAHVVALGLPVLLYLLLRARRPAGAAAGILLVAPAAAALVLSRSRAAWLAAGCSLAVILLAGWLLPRIRSTGWVRRRLALAGGSAALGVLLALLLPNELRWRSESPYLDSLRDIAEFRNGSGRGRVIQYRQTLRMVGDHPVLGVGPGNWPVEYPRYMAPRDPSYAWGSIVPMNPWPSSDWVGFLVERGVPAMAALVLAGALLAAGAVRSLRRLNDGPADAALEPLALLGLLTALGVVGLFDAVLLNPAPALLAGTALGALAPASRALGAIPLEGRRRRAVLVLVGLLGGALVLRATLRMAAMAVYTRGQETRSLPLMERSAWLDPGNYRVHIILAARQVSRGRCDPARAHLDAAAGLFPHNPAIERILGPCARARR